jgi:hypothetical protein
MIPVIRFLGGPAPMFCPLSALLCPLLLTTAVRADDAPPVPTIKIVTAAASRPTPRALRYPLLPDPLERTPGNAVVHWLRAGRAAAASADLPNKTHEQWSGEPALKDLPKEEMRKYLERNRGALRAADRAARCEHCDWEMPPLTIQTIGDIDVMLTDVQGLRALAALLSFEIRLHLSEGDYDGAARALQTGLTLGRHLGQGPTLIQCLVGIAVTGVMQSRIEDWIATPGSPNLYWSLSTLPSPFIEVRSAVRYELATLYRSFPPLRRVGREKMTTRQIESLVEEVMQSLGKGVETGDASLFGSKLGMSVVAARLYPEAKKALLAAGEKKDDVEAMPALQVVLVHLLGEYDRLSDDTLKWIALPYWQSRAGLEKVQKELTGSLMGPGGFVLGTLTPAVLKVYDAQTRAERWLAGLRCVEAVRLHATAHEGKLPAQLADVREVPLPVDPTTGKGFDGSYKKEGSTAVLELRPVEGNHSFPARRYELSEAK